MKIRHGFVSNSSSSSFLIYGIQIPDEKLRDGNVWDVAHELAEEAGLIYFNIGDGGGYYIGRSWSDVKDDETGRQFKDRVEAGVKKVFGDDAICDTHEEAGYNG